jgi:membrane protein implicated in regulation of membrane protease activity
LSNSPEVLLQLMIAFVGMVALIAGLILAYYAISFLILRVVGALLPLAGRRTRKGRRKGPDAT